MGHTVPRLARAAVIGVIAYHVVHLAHTDHIAGKAGAPARDRASNRRGDGLGERMVAEALRERGEPYSWGGGGTSGKSRGICCSPSGADGRKVIGYDCSGLVQFAAYQASGGRIRLPRTAAEQVRRGKPVSRDEMRPGDLIGFDHGEGVTHIGIYIGHGQMINAPQTGDVVKVSPLAARDHQRWVIRRLP